MAQKSMNQQRKGSQYKAGAVGHSGQGQVQHPNHNQTHIHQSQRQLAPRVAQHCNGAVNHSFNVMASLRSGHHPEESRGSVFGDSSFHDKSFQNQSYAELRTHTQSLGQNQLPAFMAEGIDNDQNRNYQNIYQNNYYER